MALALAALAQPQMAHAAADPAELAFWQSVNGTKDVREYQLYLDAYPNGAFAPIAKNRLANGGPPAPAPIPLPGPVPPGPVPAADPDGPSLTISPPSGRVGQLFTVGCHNIPENGGGDRIIVVRAGSPVLAPDANSDQMKVLTPMYASYCKSYNNSIPGFGPYAPGTYELRFMSTLYNDDHKYEMKAQTTFSVR
jgi:hypothetical protein